MSIFENKTKPELEAGNFIAYSDEPNTVVSGSGGGGGAAFYEVTTNADTGKMTLSATYTELREKMESGVVCYGVLAEEGAFMQIPIFGVTPGDKLTTYKAVVYMPLPEWALIQFESTTDNENMVYTPN